MKDINSQYIECSCHSINHTVNITYCPYENGYPGEVIITTQLTENAGLFRRIYLALKYIFGKTIKYGHWAEVIISPEDYTKIIDIFTQAQCEQEEYVKKIVVDYIGEED